MCIMQDIKVLCYNALQYKYILHVIIYSEYLKKNIEHSFSKLLPTENVV